MPVFSGSQRGVHSSVEIFSILVIKNENTSSQKHLSVLSTKFFDRKSRYPLHFLTPFSRPTNGKRRL